MEHRFRMNQEELARLYESAQKRIEAHRGHADKYRAVIQKCSYYKSEREALEAAVKKMKEKFSVCQIWAKIEKDDDIYRIANWWLVTDDGKVKQAAEFLGLALMYDNIRISKIIDDKAKLDDVIAYN